MKVDMVALKRFVSKKGIGYFINCPSLEVIKNFEGILFTNGYPNLSYLYVLAGFPF